MALLATSSDNLAVSFLQAFGDAWRSFLVISILIVLLVFRRQLIELLGRVRSFKYRNHQVDLEARQPPPSATVASESQTARPAPETDEEEAETARPVASSPLSEVAQAIIRGDLDSAEEAFKRLQAAAKDDDERESNEMMYWCWRFEWAGDTSAIAKLEAIARESPEKRFSALMGLAICSRHSNEFAQAKAIYEQALTAARSDRERARSVAGIAFCDSKQGASDAALARLEQTLSEVESAPAKSTILRAFADVYEATGDKELRAIALEKLVELNSTDRSVRFDAAFAQSNAALNRIAVGNYQSLLAFDADNLVARNNLAVLYQELKLPIRSVQAYRAASNGGETLASANLAYLLLGAGFKDEATEILNEAQSAEEPHQNVAQAIYATSTRVEAENEKLDKVTEEAQRISSFLRAFADAYLTARAPIDISNGDWALDGNTVTVTMDDSKFTATWGKEEEAKTITGTLHNAGARVRWSKKNERYPYLLSGMFAHPDKGFAYVCPENRELRVMLMTQDSVLFLTFSPADKTRR